MRTILPPTPRIAGKISIHGFNADKVNGLYYACIRPYQPELMVLGRFYDAKVAPDRWHVAELVQISAFDFEKLTESLSFLCEGVSKSTLRNLFLQDYGPEVVNQKLAMYVFRNWDKYTYINYFSQPFTHETAAQ